MVFPLEGRNYRMAVKEIGSNYALLEVPFKTSFKESSVSLDKIYKYNVLDKGFYDLSVKASNIRSDCAEVTIKYLHEEIVVASDDAVVVDDDGSLDDSLTGDEGVDTNKNLKVWVWWTIILLLVIILFIICYFIYKTLKERKKEDKNVENMAWKPSAK
jgi:hypothetical protein